MMAMRVMVITPIPMTFHCVSSAGGVEVTSPTYPSSLVMVLGDVELADSLELGLGEEGWVGVPVAGPV